MPPMGSSDWTRPGKESESLKIHQQKLLKLKGREKKRMEKIKQNIQELWDNYKRVTFL